MVYRLNLTEDDQYTILFLGSRYRWGNALRSLNVGNNFLTKYEAQRIAEAFKEDTRKGNRPLPLLSTESELYCKLMDFWHTIV